LKFFRKFSPDGGIDLEDLDTFITGLEKGESITENINQFSPDFQTEEDQDNAEQLIENIA
jgi:hypothetical protein